MRNKTMWAIRDARGLTTSEKAFLFVIESRGTAKTYRKTLMNDTGVSDGQVTNLVRSLTDKGCIVTGRDGARTTYTVSHEAVSCLVPDRTEAHSVSGSAQSVSTRAHSVSVEGSLSEDNKKNSKKNMKDNGKKNMPTVSDEPVGGEDSPSSKLEDEPHSKTGPLPLTSSDTKPNQWDGYQPKTRAEAARHGRVGVRGTSMTRTSEKPLNEW